VQTEKQQVGLNMLLSFDAAKVSAELIVQHQQNLHLLQKAISAYLSIRLNRVDLVRMRQVKKNLAVDMFQNTSHMLPFSHNPHHKELNNLGSTFITTTTITNTICSLTQGEHVGGI
jgi:hypothetical protein